MSKVIIYDILITYNSSSRRWYGNVHKKMSAVRGVVQCGHYSDKRKGGSSVRTSALVCAKNFEFFEIYCVRTDKGG